MIVVVAVMSSLMFFKSIFLIICFVVPRIYGAIFFTVFCILPDLVFSVMMAIPSVVNAFDMTQYEASEEVQHREPLQMEEHK